MSSGISVNGLPGGTSAPIPLYSNANTPSAADSGDTLLQKICYNLYQMLTAGIPVSVGGGSVTSHFQSLGASSSFNIPAGCKGWTVSFLSGTGTIGGVAVSVGFSDSDTASPSAAITVTTGSDSSAYIRYNT